MDPLFFPPPRRFRYTPPTANADLGAWLACQVARSPRQLHLHVQRIVLHAERGSSAQLAGALADLFIALGDAGGALRQRLLKACGARLDPTLVAFLVAHLDQGLRADTPLPMTLPWSRLSAGLSGTASLVARECGASVDARPLDLAREHLDAGQIAAALTVLEQALAESPEDPDLQEELLAICRATRDRARLQRFRASLPLQPDIVRRWDDTLVWLARQEART